MEMRKDSMPPSPLPWFLYVESKKAMTTSLFFNSNCFFLRRCFSDKQKKGRLLLKGEGEAILSLGYDVSFCIKVV